MYKKTFLQVDTEGVVCRCLAKWVFLKICRKTPVQESLFNKVACKLLNRFFPNHLSVWSIKHCKLLETSIMPG